MVRVLPWLMRTMATMPHPKLTEALLALEGDEGAGALIGIALSARIAAGGGRYCECMDPEVEGLDLMCRACLLNNRDQERAKVRSFAHAHAFDPDMDLLNGAFCKVCARSETDPRHHGVNAVGRTSWGETV